jgi:hypothetical protein
MGGASFAAPGATPRGLATERIALRHATLLSSHTVLALLLALLSALLMSLADAFGSLTSTSFSVGPPSALILTSGRLCSATVFFAWRAGFLYGA